ncbi:MAG: MBL fold metallo-hydrolase [SAR324 cluster bacterium]|nr:MBL fold metallo-hydrolase [SAR324 cluster bacterium]
MKYVSSLLLLSLFVLLIYWWMGEKSPELVWTMVNVNNNKAQGDAHLIQIPGGETVLIDAGYAGPAKDQLLPFLEKNQIKRLDRVFISHAHKDHYEGLKILIEAGIAMDQAFFNLPRQVICDKEKPWGCDYTDILKVHEQLKKHGTRLKIAEAGQQFDLGGGISLKILYAYDGVETPIGQTDINDTSLIMMLTHQDHKFLFAGDLNTRIGKYLAEHGEGLQAEVLKVPHHGTAGIAPNEFFEKVSPKYALVPGPRELWCSKRSSEPRNWFAEQNIPVFVNGFSGNVRVEILGSQLQIIPEKKAGELCS